jgi:hypothetical protein
MTKIKIVYFINLVPDKWKSILHEQLGNLKKIDLYERADEIYISVVGSINELNELNNIINNDYKKIKVKNCFSENLFEYPGFKTLYEISEKDSIILYFHSKGIFSGVKSNDNNLIRKMMFQNVITNYDTYLKKFDEDKNICVGTLYPGVLGSTWYNFFWVRGEYVINNLEHPQINSNRFYWEHWVGKPKTNVEVLTYSPIYEYKKVEHRNEIYKINPELFKNLI